MDRKRAERTAAEAEIRLCQPGDKISGPRGEIIYEEPSLFMQGWRAFMFVIRGKAVAVLIWRPGSPVKLRWCDMEGRPHDEDVRGIGENEIMHNAMRRVGELVRTFMGERHPLAQVASANNAAA